MAKLYVEGQLFLNPALSLTQLTECETFNDFVDQTSLEIPGVIKKRRESLFEIGY